MVCVSNSLFIVFKRTGGRAWLKPWGFTGLTQTQKANHGKQREVETSNRNVLRIAEASHWDLLDSLGAAPPWGESIEKTRLRKLGANQKLKLWNSVASQIIPSILRLQQHIVEEAGAGSVRRVSG